MKIRNLNIRRSRRTRGIALLFALGILSAVLVVAMLFASKARVDARLTAVSTDNQAARLLAKSLIPRVVLTLNISGSAQSMMLFSSSYDENVFSSGSYTPLDYDWIWKLESPGFFEFDPYNPYTDTNTDSSTVTSVPQGYVYVNRNDPPDYDARRLPSWQYIRDADNSRLLARFAFVTMPQAAQLNPNAIADHAHCRKTWGSGNANNPGDDSQEELKCSRCAQRPGVSAAELFYNSDLFTENKDFDEATRQNYRRHFPQNYINSSGKTQSSLRTAFYSRGKSFWYDLNSFINYFFDTSLGLDPSAEELTAYYAQQTDLRNAFDVTVTKDNEAFWVDINRNGIVDLDELYHRFNLRRTDWDKIGVAEGAGGTAEKTLDGSSAKIFLLSEPKKFQVNDKGEPIAPSTSQDQDGHRNYDTGGIAWLNSWKDGGDWNDADATKKQIAANLINFCSPATRPVVSDVTPTEWKTRAPSFTGLKRTLYINEMFYDAAFKADYNAEELENADGTKTGETEITITYRPKATFFVELIDMYYDTLGMKFRRGTPSSDNNTEQLLRTEPPDFSAYQPVIIGSISYEYNAPTGNESQTDEARWVAKNEPIQLTGFDMFGTQNFGGSGRSSDYLQNDSGYYGYVKEYNLPEVTVNKFRIATSTYNSGDNKLKKYVPRVRNIEIKIDRILLKRKAAYTGDSTMPANQYLEDGYEYVDCANLESSYVYNNTTYQTNSERQDFAGTTADDGILLDTGTESIERTVQGHFEVPDPRQNLRRSDWEAGHYNAGNAYRIGTLQYVPYRGRAAKVDQLDEQKAPPWIAVASFPVTGNYADAGANNQLGTNFIYRSRNNCYTKRIYGFPEAKPAGIDVNYQPDDSTVPTQDIEAVAFSATSYGPAWRRSNAGVKGIEGATAADGHLSTAFIRHATLSNIKDQFEMPMMSLWELGAIHRGSRWKTLNLSMSPTYKENEPMTLESGGGDYKDGDAPILDQVKMTDDLQVMGKLNLQNTYTSETVKRFSLGALFYGMKFRKDGNYISQLLENGDMITTGVGNDKQIIWIKSGTDLDYQTLVDHLNNVKDALLDKANFPEKKARLLRRTDLLVSQVQGKNAAGGTETFSLNKLRRPISDANTDALREQIIGRMINHLKIESSIHSVNAVILVQMIRDSGGGRNNDTSRSWVKDWNSNGFIDGDKDIKSADPVAQYAAGYRRFTDARESTRPNNIFRSKDASFSSTAGGSGANMIREKASSGQYGGQLGRYDHGADEICGEAKVIVSLVYDSSAMKWKVQNYEFAE